MKTMITFGVIMLLISTLLALFIITYFLIFGRRSKLCYAFLSVQGLLLIWCTGHIVEITTTNDPTRWLAVCFRSIGVCFIGYTWFYFACHYTGNRLKDSKGLWIGLFLIPFILYIGFITNPLHGMTYTVLKPEAIGFGPVFLIHIGFTYSFIFAGCLAIVKYSRKLSGRERCQAIILCFGGLIPILFSTMYVLKIVVLPFAITPVTLPISIICFTVATVKYRFMNTIPLALRRVFETLEVSTILIDNDGSVIASNPAFRNAFSGNGIHSLDELEVFIEQKSNKHRNLDMIIGAIRKGVDQPLFGELELGNPTQVILQVAAHPVYDRKRQIMGWIMTFKDITSYMLLTQELGEKNNQLEQTNWQLKENMYIAEELAILKERNRLAQAIHDTLGHTLTLLVKIQEASILDYESDSEKTLTALKKTNEITRNGLKELRMSISNMMPSSRQSGALIEDLKRFSAIFSSWDVKIDIHYEGNMDQIPPTYAQTIYKVCQEAITNSLKHGNATEIHVMVRFLDKEISLFIIDNGSGCKKIVKGYGLSGMENRVQELGGTIGFGSDGEQGFNIHVKIPVENGI